MQVSAQHEEAIELYMAADRPRQALAILNQQLSSTIDKAVEEVVSGTPGVASESVEFVGAGLVVEGVEAV